mgnify:CR=1 FL=1
MKFKKVFLTFCEYAYIDSFLCINTHSHKR